MIMNKLYKVDFKENIILGFITGILAGLLYALLFQFNLSKTLFFLPLKAIDSYTILAFGVATLLITLTGAIAYSYLHQDTIKLKLFLIFLYGQLIIVGLGYLLNIQLGIAIISFDFLKIISMVVINAVIGDVVLENMYKFI